MKSKCVLLVEDNRDDRELIRLAVKKANLPCKVESVLDGAEITDYLFGTGIYHERDLRMMPDLILLDLHMPKLNGCQVLQVLKRARGTSGLPPVVVLTASDSEQDVTDAYHWGANSYIRKAVDFTQFVESVRQVLLYWLELNVPPPVGQTVTPQLVN